MGIACNFLRVTITALTFAVASQALAAEGGTWSVSKSSGEVWIMNGDVQQASLKAEDHLNAGDTIRTGRNGRVLLVRGEESILVAPNSVIGLPAEQKEGLSTTIIQRTGSILLEVEKRNVKHFEVETPYLAAVVKGTQFRVSVNATGTKVDVMRGQVEVADFKSGQIAQVMPGQSATAFEHGKPGLSLSGPGTFKPIEQGKPRPSSVDRVQVPKGGFPALRSAASAPSSHGTIVQDKLRISSALGEVKLDVHKVTRGLARGSSSTNSANRNIANNSANNTIWSSGSTSNTNAASSASSGSGSSAASSSASSSVSTTVAAAPNAGSANNNGNGNPANGNGNGNGGVGNGNGKGNLKH